MTGKTMSSMQEVSYAEMFIDWLGLHACEFTSSQAEAIMLAAYGNAPKPLPQARDKDSPTLSKSADPSTAKIGDIVHWTIEIDNVTSEELTDVRPREFCFPLPLVGGSLKVNGATVIDNFLIIGIIPSIPPGGKVAIEYDLSVDGSARQDKYSNMVQLDFKVGGISNTLYAWGNVLVDLGERLAKKANKALALPGESVEYELDFTNPMNSTLTHVTLSDFANVGIVYIVPGSLTVNGVASDTPVLMGMALDDIPPYGTLHVAYTVKIPPDGGDGNLLTDLAYLSYSHSGTWSTVRSNRSSVLDDKESRPGPRGPVGDAGKDAIVCLPCLSGNCRKCRGPARLARESE